MTKIQAIDLHRILIGTASNDEASGNRYLSYQETVSNIIIEFQVPDPERYCGMMIRRQLWTRDSINNVKWNVGWVPRDGAISIIK
jgi:hypothetical protein